ncbi:MAG: M23 family metallopeptidase [Flavobacteriia bacterium]|nr:M23 family metallopeptidase [Flavobacteriia bacterium]
MRLSLTYLGILFVVLSSGQSLPWPMDIPPLLSGTFGELRSGHFHAGVDIKTQGKEGQAVRSIWQGHVSRIKVSPYGYGHALYIDHPNGKTTVYAHLQRFEEDIQAYVRSLQYKKRSFAIDVHVPKGKLPIDSAAIIGRSGNSGSSGGPHLHFELRDSKSQHTLNP